MRLMKLNSLYINSYANIKIIFVFTIILIFSEEETIEKRQNSSFCRIFYLFFRKKMNFYLKKIIFVKY